MALEILFENDSLIAINKPPGLLVHRSRIANDATEFALQQLRDQIHQRVYPVHRLDRKTSGVLLFTKSKEKLQKVQSLFVNRKIVKKYQAIVRGYTDSSGVIDYPIINGTKSQKAVTRYRCIQQFEIPWSHRGFSTSRYTLLEIIPETGRMHQIRRHMAHIRHPIIGDRPHGCNKQNRLWKQQCGLMHMLLHATSLEFKLQNESYQIQAPMSLPFQQALELLVNKDQSSYEKR